MPKSYWKNCVCALCICGMIMLALNVAFNTKLNINGTLVVANKFHMPTHASAVKVNPGHPSWINNVSIFIKRSI